MKIITTKIPAVPEITIIISLRFMSVIIVIMMLMKKKNNEKTPSEH